jgi:hypothetical protein
MSSTFRVTTLPLIAGLFLQVAHAQQPLVEVVSPNHYATEDAGIFVVPNCCGPFHYQQVFPASDFAALGDRPHWLYQFSLRPDKRVSAPQTFELGHLQLRMSTTNTSPENLGALFEENAGVDERIVFDGPFISSTQNMGPAEGPKEFDDVYKLQDSFLYDPRAGNLLVEWISRSGGKIVTSTGDPPVAGADSFSHPHMMIYADGADAESGGYDGGLVYKFSFHAVIDGDFNGNSLLDVGDIDLLSDEVRRGTNDVGFDLNSDGKVTQVDRSIWVDQLRKTWFGDANLDGEFNSGDFVLVFQQGEYEDSLAGNSGWADGDWNGDSEFSSVDFVTAFQGGGFELGPRLSTAAAPEPASWGLLSTCVFGIAYRCRKVRSVTPI